MEITLDELDDIQRYCDNIVKIQNFIHDDMEEIETNLQFLRGLMEKIKSK